MEPEHTDSASPRRAVVIGASRGLGLAVTRLLLQHGWRVVATVRVPDAAPIRELSDEFGAQVQVARLDITEPDDIAALARQLAGQHLDLLYVNAGIATGDVPVGTVSTDDFQRVMTTNALSPMRVVEEIGPLVDEHGTIAVVSSRQGSISMNERGGHEVYRASKAALNQLMRSWAARGQHGQRTLVLLHPGWVRTGLGGDQAPLGVDESATGLVSVVEGHHAPGTLRFLDHQGHDVAW